ncbi:MAG: hypothetical protein A3E00_12085 [Curvibacter sp. RIFCSPHIGHO2_12_FULL_63_18]|uniref:hypothetical protein n=1 Tax=Rhodoferax sp. TaxID=50421 RepID=UPI0008D7BF68|nr:hypothetical protein [Rhodoferax sp.]OGP00986.1 MAG: hypothetical protein A3E00_12085 [Curvibacter sp. RIFCSPHIGHO2_12_FULL_63_18]
MKAMINFVRGVWTKGRHLINHYWVWSGTFLCALYVGLLALYSETVWNWLSNTNAPAWVQAVGSVIAIVAAFSIANSQSNTQRQEQAKRERASAAVVARAMVAQLATLNAACKSIKEFTSVESDRTFITSDYVTWLNNAESPTNENLLHLASAIPDAAMAYIDAFEMRETLLATIRSFASTHLVNLQLSVAQRTALYVLADDGANQCAVAATGIKTLYSDSQRSDQKALFNMFAAPRAR